ncbi:MAG: hypothetical protein V5B34_11080 [Accumulibacter sp.]
MDRQNIARHLPGASQPASSFIIRGGRNCNDRYLEFHLADAMRLIAVQFGPGGRSISKAHRGDRLLLPPTANPVSLPQQGKLPNTAAFGDGPDIHDLADDTEFH